MCDSSTKFQQEKIKRDKDIINDYILMYIKGLRSEIILYELSSKYYLTTYSIYKVLGNIKKIQKECKKVMESKISGKKLKYLTPDEIHNIQKKILTEIYNY